MGQEEDERLATDFIETTMRRTCDQKSYTSRWTFGKDVSQDYDPFKKLIISQHWLDGSA